MHHSRFSLPELAVSHFKTCCWSTHSDSKFMDEMHLFLWNRMYSSLVGSGAKPSTLFYVRIQGSKFGVASFQTILQLVKANPRGTQRLAKRRQMRLNHSVWSQTTYYLISSGHPCLGSHAFLIEGIDLTSQLSWRYNRQIPLKYGTLHLALTTMTWRLRT